MPSSYFCNITIFVFIFLVKIIVITEAAVTYNFHFCSNTTTFKPNTTYQTNLKHLLSYLSSNSTTTKNSFYNTTAGGSTNETIYGFFLCRGDVPTSLCRECVDTASQDVLARCPEQKVSTIWYDECMIRYSNQSIFGLINEVPAVAMRNTANVTDPDQFNEVLADTLKDLSSEVVNDPTKKFAVKQVNFSRLQTIYTLAQCTPDLTVPDCSRCLTGAIARFPDCCSGTQGARNLLPSCNVRYELYPFYYLNATTPSQPSTKKGNLVTIIETTEAAVTYNYHSCSNTSTFKPNTIYQTNLRYLLSSLSSNSTNTNTNGFYNTTAGRSPDETISGLFLCRGDVVTSVCRECVQTASAFLLENCPVQKESVIWYDECMIRYSNLSIFGIITEQVPVLKTNDYRFTDPDRFNEVVRDALEDLSSKASNDPDKKFAVKQVDFMNDTIYTLAQCTLDLTVSNCRNCLTSAISSIPATVYKGARILLPSCNLRYELYPFYLNAITPSSSPQPSVTDPPVSTKKVTRGGNDTAMIVGITVSSIAVVAAVLGFCFYRYCKKCRPEDYETSLEILNGDLEDQDHNGEMQCFRLTTIMAATNNFSDSNKLGEGGFGPVYKGKLVDGKEIAVKRLSLKSGQGLKEFKNEVTFIVKLQHNNLVRLLGCCVERNEKLLVYEYLANTSLDTFLFDQEKCKQLDWDLRANIVSGIAKGIQYLHEDSRLKIIHRDLKASNVLLDDEMNPKISDFGTARMFAPKQKEDSTNRPVGTYGYMAPEYAMEGLFSMKSDVYSFGILLLEIVSGKKNSGFYKTDHTHSQSLLSYVWQLWNEGKGQELIDQNIIDTCSTTEALRWIHIALLCIQEDPNDRPSISSVILMLCSKISDLPRPSAPPFSVSRFLLSDQSLTTTGGAGNGFDQSSTNASLCR